MKKIVCLTLALMLTLSLFAAPAFASQYVGTVYKTDTVCYINNVPINCYVMDDYMFIQVEDLENHGFDIKWNAYNETLRIMKDDNKSITYDFSVYRPRFVELYEEWFDMYTTSVRTYIGNYGYEIECLAGLPGCTYINVDNLSVFGSVNWSEEDNAMYISTNRLGFVEPLVIMEDPKNVPWFTHMDVYEYESDDDYYYEFTHLVNGKGELSFDFGYFSSYNGFLSTASACSGTFYADIYDTEGRKVYTTSEYFSTSEVQLNKKYKLGEARAPWTYKLKIPQGKLTAGESYMAYLTFWCPSCDRGYSERYYFDMPYYGKFSSDFLNKNNTWTWRSF